MTIQDTVARVRAKYTTDPTKGPTNDECAAICNEVAWIHRNDPEQWGVSGKAFGTYGTRADGVRIAVDILQNGRTLEIVDCLYAAGGPDAQGRYGPATPTWQPGGVLNDASRPWTAPIAPDGVPPTPPDPPAPPSTECPCRAELALLRQDVAVLIGAVQGLANDHIELEALARVGRTFQFRIFGVNGTGSVNPVP